MDNRPVIIIAFANSEYCELKYLSNEMKACLNHLQKIDNEVKIRQIFNTTITDIQEEIRKYKDRIIAFMFSGHSGQLDIETNGHAMSAIGLAKELGFCDNLKLVILNGCNSDGHIQHLSKVRVPIIIATQSPVQDHKSSIFSAKLFAELSNGNTIENSFDKAVNDAQNYDTSNISVIKSMEKTRFLNQMTTPPSNQWLLHCENKEDNEWTIFEEVRVFKKVSKFNPNKNLKEFLFNSLKNMDEGIAENVGYSDSQNRILNKFPAFISQHIHDLCASKIGDSDMNTYFDQADEKRLQKILDFFTAIQEVLLCLVLAEIRELYMDSKDIVQNNSEHHFKLIQIPEFNKMRMVTAGVKLLLNSKTSLLVTDISEIDEEKRRQLVDIANYFEEINNKIKTHNRDGDNAEKLHKMQIANLCENAELKLISLLEMTLFLVNYKFVSIKNITVFKNRAKKHPLFNFELAVYEWQKSGYQDPANKVKKELIELLPDNFSVLVLRAEGSVWELIEKGKYLNVSPFMIDKNVMYEKSNIPHISFLDVYSTTKFTYRSLFTKGDPQIIHRDSVDLKYIFDDLQSQFTHFNELLNP